MTKYDQIGLSGLLLGAFQGLFTLLACFTASLNLAPQFVAVFCPVRQLSSRRTRRCRPPCKLSQLTLCRHINGPPSQMSSTGTPPYCPHPQLPPESANVPINTQSHTRRSKKSTQTVGSEKSLSSRTPHHPPRHHLQRRPARMAILHPISPRHILLR